MFGMERGEEERDIKGEKVGVGVMGSRVARVGWALD